MLRARGAVVIPIGLDSADIAAMAESPHLRLPAPWRADKMAGGYVTALLLALAIPAAAQDHPPLRHRVVHIISRAQLEAICPGTYSCAIPRPPDTCLVFLPARVPAQWPTRAAMLRHEFRHCAGRGQD